MSYAVRNDGLGWRAVAGPQDCMIDETWQLDQPPLTVMDKSLEIRIKRDQLLSESDWTQLLDSPFSSEAKIAWSTYRQYLRDITKQSGFPSDVSWPTSP